ATQSFGQSLVTRFRVINRNGNSHEVIGVFNGKGRSVAVGDSVLIRTGDDCVTGVFTAVTYLDPFEGAYSGFIDAPIPFDGGTGIIYSGELSDIPVNVPTNLIGCLLSKTTGGGGSAPPLPPPIDTTPPPSLVYTLEMTSLYDDHPNYPRTVGDNDNNQEAGLDIAPYLQALVDSAAVTGGTILLGPWRHTIKSTITVPQGVIIKGQGAGKFSEQLPITDEWNDSGTLIYFQPSAPDQPAFQFIPKKGVMSRLGGLQDMVIMDDNSFFGTKAILINGDSTRLSGGRFKDVYIHGFQKGVGIKVTATWGGGVENTVFEDVQVFNADTAVFVIAGSNSIVRDNTFERLKISGNNFSYGVLVTTEKSPFYLATCRNIQFIGGSINGLSSKRGHFVVEPDATVNVQGMSFEALLQISYHPDTPVVRLLPGTQGSHLDIFGSIPIQNDGGNIVKSRAINNIFPSVTSGNQASNSAFTGLDFNIADEYILPGWRLDFAQYTSNTYSPIHRDSLEIGYHRDTTDKIPEEFNIIKVRIPPGKKVRLRLADFFGWRQHIGEPYSVSIMMFPSRKVYARWSSSVITDRGFTVLSMSDPARKVNDWNLLGGGFQLPVDAASFSPELVITNDPAVNMDTADVLLAVPGLYWGEEMPMDYSGKVKAPGAEFSGVVSKAVVTVDLDDPRYQDPNNPYRFHFPVTANVFKLRSSTYRIIRNINDIVPPTAANPDAEFFPGGTVITLINESPGNISIYGRYGINLLNNDPLLMRDENSYITLVSDPNTPGQWYEIGRGQIANSYGYAPIDFSNPLFIDANTYTNSADSIYNLVIPYDVNVVDIDVVGSGKIRYINRYSEFKDVGEIIMLRNRASVNDSIILEYPYVQTADSQNIVLHYGDYVILMQTDQIGIWREVNNSTRMRQQATAPSSSPSGGNAGFLAINPDTAANQMFNGDVTHIVYPPEYHYLLYRGSQMTIMNINNDPTLYVPAGEQIVFENGRSSFMILFNTSIINPVKPDVYTVLEPGARAILVSRGDGTW
ncbi:MAG: hypothetical protein D6746_09720, partial [Bacteroidetes bacterium]